MCNMAGIFREDIGRILKEGYPDDDDKHIEYFYFTFIATRNERSIKDIAQDVFSEEEFITQFYLVHEMSVVNEPPSGHGEAMFMYFVKYKREGTERQRENALEDISIKIKKKTNIPPSVIITRACKYTKLNVN